MTCVACSPSPRRSRPDFDPSRAGVGGSPGDGPEGQGAAGGGGAGLGEGEGEGEGEGPAPAEGEGEVGPSGEGEGEGEGEHGIGGNPTGEGEGEGEGEGAGDARCDHVGGMLFCEDECVDVGSSQWHCGECGNLCESGMDCHDGVCGSGVTRGGGIATRFAWTSASIRRTAANVGRCVT